MGWVSMEVWLGSQGLGFATQGLSTFSQAGDSGLAGFKRAGSPGAKHERETKRHRQNDPKRRAPSAERGRHRHKARDVESEEDDRRRRREDREVPHKHRRYIEDGRHSRHHERNRERSRDRHRDHSRRHASYRSSRPHRRSRSESPKQPAPSAPRHNINADLTAAIPGYPDMSAAQKLKARTQYQLQQSSKVGKLAAWILAYLIYYLLLESSQFKPAQG